MISVYKRAKQAKKAGRAATPAAPHVDDEAISHASDKKVPPELESQFGPYIERVHSMQLLVSEWARWYGGNDGAIISTVISSFER